MKNTPIIQIFPTKLSGPRKKSIWPGGQYRKITTSQRPISMRYLAYRPDNEFSNTTWDTVEIVQYNIPSDRCLFLRQAFEPEDLQTLCLVKKQSGQHLREAGLAVVGMLEVGQGALHLQPAQLVETSKNYKCRQDIFLFWKIHRFFIEVKHRKSIGPSIQWFYNIMLFWPTTKRAYSTYKGVLTWIKLDSKRLTNFCIKLKNALRVHVF